MQEFHSKDSLSYPLTCWENSVFSNSNVKRSSSMITDNNCLTLTKEMMLTHFPEMKQTEQAHDSSSTQSTGGESFSEVVSFSEPNNRYGHNIVTNLSGYKENPENLTESHSKSILSNMSQDSVVLPMEVASWPLYNNETRHFNGLLSSRNTSQHTGFDDSYLLHEFDECQAWEWDQTQDPGHGFTTSYSQDLSACVGFEASNMDVVTGAPFIDSDSPPQLEQPNDQSKKRNSDELSEVQKVKRSSRSKRKANKSSERSCKDGNKEERWAEQLLNPCASAIMARNSSRVQHYFCVLSELASSSGDANHRLAAFGLRALQYHLSSSSVSLSSWPVVTFASAEVKMFQKILLKFYEVSPWFALPNNMANSAILQILEQDPPIDKKDLHILDIGVSHGMQWPTFLEALSCRPEGPPRVRITVISDIIADIPFSVGPPGYNYGSQLIDFAKSLNIHLQINTLDNFQLIDTSPHETLIVCAQFRLHLLKHSNPDERSEALKALRSLGPKGMVLCENNGESSSSEDFAAGFSTKLEYMWKFLDSTSYGFKEENSEERKLMEGEATKILMNGGYMNEGKDKWYDRMRKAGFATEPFGEDAIDGAKSLLRKYDNNWELRMEDGDTFSELLWKGEAVSFCSLWK